MNNLSKLIMLHRWYLENRKGNLNPYTRSQEITMSKLILQKGYEHTSDPYILKNKSNELFYIKTNGESFKLSSKQVEQVKRAWKRDEQQRS